MFQQRLKRLRVMADPKPAMNETRRRRIYKRCAILRKVKSSSEYAACLMRPPAPDPYDGALSKRHWGVAVATWRRGLRGQARPIDWLGRFEKSD